LGSTVGGIDDYPRTLTEFNQWFPTAATCRDYLVRLRWPDGFRCSRCGGAKGWPLRGRGLVKCASCGYQASVLAGTIFQDTHKPLLEWFQVIWLVTSQKYGASALSIKQNLGFGSYETARSWLHKLRAAMVRPERDRLKGPVEVDEAWVGGLDADGLGGRHTNSKSAIAIAIEIEGQSLGRVRMRRIYATDGGNLVTFVKDVVEPGSTVHHRWLAGLCPPQAGGL
jgi:Transposase zinc-ribbon domain/ISXO2-like transposase domain